MSATACCKAPAFLEPLSEVVVDAATGASVRFRFGDVGVCTKCWRPAGQPRMAWARGQKELSARQAAFTATSWKLMLKVHPQPPYFFTRAAEGIMVPDGYTGELHAQADFT